MLQDIVTTVLHKAIKLRVYGHKTSGVYFLHFVLLLGNAFPHMTIFHQTTLNIFCHKIENLYNWMDNLWLKVENIVAKGEIARFGQFLLLSLCFQKAVCCRGVRKRLYEGKTYCLYGKAASCLESMLFEVLVWENQEPYE